MEHHFDVDIAKEYGWLEAVLLNHFAFWIKHNEANGKNFHDGFYWTYNTTKAMSEIFPYVSERSIRTAINHLKNEDILKTANYNDVAYDRTLWYTLSEKGKSILQNREMDSAKLSNGFGKIVEPIPDIIPDKEPDKKPDVIIGADAPEASPQSNIPYDKILDLFNRICASYRPIKGMSGKRRERVAGRWREHPDLETFATVFRNAEASSFMRGDNNRNWIATFDWMMRPSNFQKVLEGNYENRTPVRPAEEDRDPMLAYLDKVINGEIDVPDTFGTGGESNDTGRDGGDNQGPADSLSEFLFPVQGG